MTISVSPSATPFVHRLRRRLERQGEALAQMGDGITGVVVVVESQRCASVFFGAGGIRIEPGAFPESEASIIDGCLSPDEMSPHLDTLRMAMALPALRWREEAEMFWKVAASSGGIKGLTIVCTDDGETLQYGSIPGYVIYASGDSLAACFSGEALLADLVFAGAAQVDGSLADLSALTGAGMELVMHG